jgi:hypothetical protein
MIWLAWFVMIFALLRLLVALSNLLGRQWLKIEKAETSALVSVLIPARNEAHNLPVLLEGLLQQDHHQLEILIYDDHSEDDTWAIIQQFEHKHPNLKGIRGVSLPQGWLGKNHACHQLARKATGDYLLFLDADVIPQPTLVSSALAHMRKYGLQLLSIFPDQEMKTPGEKLSVPLMHWVLVSLLPLKLTREAASPSFAAANGQLMMFEAGSYRQHQWHQKVKNRMTEDIHIARMMKQQGLRIHTVLGGGLISCRMYTGWQEAAKGFSRNVLDFFGGSIWAGPLFALVTTLGFLPVGWAWGGPGLAIYFGLALLIRLVVSLAGRQPLLQNLLLAPLQQLAFTLIVVGAVRNRLLRRNTWKGRKIDQA